MVKGIAGFMLAASMLVPTGTLRAAAQAPAPAQQPATPPAPAAPRTPDVIFVPTPAEVATEMLKLAKVTKDDVVYDLGCGDGAIVVAAAKEFGARGVGIDIDPQRIKEAKERAAKAGVSDRVQFIQGDLFEADIKPATVVALYLLPSLNVKLRPKLWKDLKPGTRIVSHSFDMAEWKAEETKDVNGRTIYFWTITPDVKSRAN